MTGQMGNAWYEKTPDQHHLADRRTPLRKRKKIT
jgi:hypothetical protein